MSDDTLFGGYEPTPLPPSRDPNLSADRRRTLRQAEQIRSGTHPLTGGPLHLLGDIYARSDDGKNLPYRCGSCAFREVLDYHGKKYPKCTREFRRRDQDAADYEARTDPGPLITHGTATDVRAWWPACRDYSPGDNALSPDAARSLP